MKIQKKKHFKAQNIHFKVIIKKAAMIYTLMIAIVLSSAAYAKVQQKNTVHVNAKQTEIVSSDNPDNFTDLFKEVKLKLANNKELEAIPLLEKLYALDKNNANVQYLLGYCYVKQRMKIPEAIRLLKAASKNYSKEYDPGSLKETRVSEYVYYYLIIAYSLNGDCQKTQETLNQFYSIYSYYDEWYLVEGQKWVRECLKQKKKDDKVADEIVIKEGMNSEISEEKSQLNAPDETVLAENAVSEVVEEQAGDKEKKNRKAKRKNKTSEESYSDERNESNKLKQQEIDVRWKDNFFEDTELKNQTTARPEFRDRLLQYDPVKNQVVTKEIKYSTQSALYGVQVGAFFSPKYLSEFKNLKNLEVYVDKNGVFRYVVGRLLYRQQAEKLLEYIRLMGYSDAFIVDINGGKYTQEVVTVNEQSLKRKFTGSVEFRVQIGAFRRDLPPDLALHYVSVQGIKEYIEDDLTLLTIGNFKKYGLAKDYAERIKEIGIDDAFVVAFAKDQKIPIEEAIKLSQLFDAEEVEDNNYKPSQERRAKKSKGNSDF